MNFGRVSTLFLVAMFGMAAVPAWSETGAVTGSRGADNQTTPTAVDGSTTAGVTADVCVVSDEPLGSMGAPYVLEHNGRKVSLCCKGCVEQFKEDPEKYMGKVDAQIIARQGKNYASKVCVVTGRELPAGGGKEIVVNEQLVRLCCGGCEAAVRADPDKYLSTPGAPRPGEQAPR